MRYPASELTGKQMLFDRLKRREFIALLGGAAAWPHASRAQQVERPPTVGFLGGQSPAGMSHLVAAFVLRLRELGWIEGRNIAIQHRWWGGRSATEAAAELVRLNVDVIVAGGTCPCRKLMLGYIGGAVRPELARPACDRRSARSAGSV